MPETIQQIISDTARTMVTNETTRVLNGLLHQTSALEPLQAENPDDAAIAAGVMSLVQAPVKIVGGALMMVGGIFLSVIPRTVMSIGTVEVLYQEDGAPESDAKVRTDINSVDVENRPGRTPFHYTRTGEIKAFADDQHVKSIDVEQTVITRPRLPFIDPPERVMDYSKRPTPVYYAEAKTSVTGYGFFSTGLSTLVSGAIDPVKGLSTSAFLGGKKVINFFKKENEAPIEMTDMSSIQPKRS